MRLLSTFRSLSRAALGRRPLQRDLERIIKDLRQQLLRGETPRPFKFPRLKPATALRQLRQHQLRKLKRTIAYVSRHLPYYQRTLAAAGIDSQSIRTLDDIRRLPITRRSDLQSCPTEFISRAPGLTPSVRLHSSGTTGKPIEMFLTNDEFEYYVAIQAISGMMFGYLGPQHIVQLHLPLDTSIAARLFIAAAQKTGTLVLHAGVTGTLDRHLESIFEERNIPSKPTRVTSIIASPGYLWALTARAEELGYDGRKSGVRRIFTCGAMVSDALRQRVQAAWGIRLLEGYSLIETLATGAYECDHGRLHFLDMSGLIEFLHPETHEPVAPGETGIAVITSFYPDREMSPMLRYWTDDLMRSSADLCPCGLVTTSIDDILGRADHMIVVGALNIYPQPVGDALTAFRELVQPPRFQLWVEERSSAQYSVVEVECAAPLEESGRRQLEERIHKVLPMNSTAHVISGVVKSEVRLVPPGSIQTPFRYKLQGPAPKQG